MAQGGEGGVETVVRGRIVLWDHGVVLVIRSLQRRVVAHQKLFLSESRAVLGIVLKLLRGFGEGGKGRIRGGKREGICTCIWFIL